MNKALAIILFGAPLFAGCAAWGPAYLYSASKAEAALQRQPAADKAPDSLAPPDEPTPHMAAVDPRQVIYTASLDIVVGEVPQAVEAARALAERMGGYVQRRTIRSIIVRVPADRFSQAVAELEKAGTVTERDIRAVDVTEEYVDLSTRLRNYQSLLARLEGMLPKAASVKEVLE
ncbi:MAG TPA: DUF4349 domain-containing protein, partial [Phycisphaerae bacterium]|nr:DUF4349 domain-containing protein [Phycisphaerae bacterium]